MTVESIFDLIDAGDMDVDDAFNILKTYEYKSTVDKLKSCLENHKATCNAYLTTGDCNMVHHTQSLLRRLSDQAPIIIPILSKATDIARRTYGSKDINAWHLFKSLAALITIIIAILKFVLDYL